MGHFGPLWATVGSVAKFNAAVTAHSLWCKAGAVAASHNFEKDYNFEEWLQPIPIGTKNEIIVYSPNYTSVKRAAKPRARMRFIHI